AIVPATAVVATCATPSRSCAKRALADVEAGSVIAKNAATGAAPPSTIDASANASNTARNDCASVSSNPNERAHSPFTSASTSAATSGVGTSNAGSLIAT